MPGRTDTDGTVLSDSEEWSLNAARKDEGNNVVLTQFDGAFTSIKAGQNVGSFAIDSGSYLRVGQQDASGSVPSANSELFVAVRGMAGSTTVNGALHVADGKLDKSKTKFMPTTMSFDGSLKRKDATVFSGKVALTRKGYENYDALLGDTDTNFVADVVSISGSLTVPNRPVLSLTVGATRTGLNSTDVSAQYRDGSSVINASVSAKIGERHPLVKVSSADGVAFSFISTSAPVDVTKDGAVVARLDLAKGMITYIDGSYESLK
jgi:hypothetical protein